MDITLNLPERILREAERLAREEGVRVASYLADAVEEYVKTASQQRAVAQIHELLGWAEEARTPDHSSIRVRKRG